jgi:lysozyme
MKTLGVDVSHWEGNIDWLEASHWIPFAYYKCTDGIQYVDTSFVANKQGCSAAGIPHAPYHYYQQALDAFPQADHFVSTAGDGYHRLIVDVEEPNTNSDRLHDCLVKIEQLSGIRPAIYTSADKWNNQVKPFPAWSKDYELIVAHYTIDHQPMLPIGWTRWRIWQFTDH